VTLSEMTQASDRDKSWVKGLDYNHLSIGMTLWVRLDKAMTKGCWSLTKDRAYKRLIIHVAVGANLYALE